MAMYKGDSRVLKAKGSKGIVPLDGSISNNGVIRSLPLDQDMLLILGNQQDVLVYGTADPNSGTATLLKVANGLGLLVQKGKKPLQSNLLLRWSGEEYRQHFFC